MSVSLVLEIVQFIFIYPKCSGGSLHNNYPQGIEYNYVLRALINVPHSKVAIRERN
jgi:hypothetical protein